MAPESFDPDAWLGAKWADGDLEIKLQTHYRGMSVLERMKSALITGWM